MSASTIIERVRWVLAAGVDRGLSQVMGVLVVLLLTLAVVGLIGVFVLTQA